MSYVVVVALQKRLGKRLEDALLEMLKEEMSITEISERLVIARSTIDTLIKYLGYEQYVATRSRRQMARKNRVIQRSA